MFPKEVEVILARHLASCLAVPIFIIDASGALVYYNESAEEILGRRFDESGDLPDSEWPAIFQAMDAKGTPLAREALPLMRALTERRPVQCTFWLRASDGARKRFQTVAFPLVGQAKRFLGAMAIFWEG